MGSRTQRYEDILHDITVALQREGLSFDLVEEDEESFDEQEVEDKIYEEGYQPLEEEQESPHDSIEDNEDLIKEREPKKVNHEEDQWIHEVEHELPCEYVEEAHHIE